MHSLNHADLGHAVAAARADVPRPRAVRPRPRRPPTAVARTRVAYASGRLARRLDRETARRAVA